MYEQAVDRQSGHFKAALNRIKNEDRVFAVDDANADVPDNDTAHSFAWMDLRAEPIVRSVPAVDAKRYYSIMLSLRDGADAVWTAGRLPVSESKLEDLDSICWGATSFPAS